MNSSAKCINVSSRVSFTSPARFLSAIFRIFCVCARNLCATIAFAAFAWVAPCQEISSIEPTADRPHINSERSDTSEHESRHILGIIPNYRTFPSLQNYKPLSSGDKFKIGSEDSLDRGTFALAAIFGGLGQLTDGNKSFGQGAAGFGRYFGASLWGSADRQLHDGVYLSIHSPPGSSILPAWDGKWPLRVCLRHFTDFLDSSRLRRHSIQLLRMAWKLHRSSDIECLLSRSTGCGKCDIETGHADRRRRGREHSEGVLAGPAAQIWQEIAIPRG